MATEKETTAPIPSVAPDGEQPSALARTDSITDSETAHKQFGKIQAVTMPELMETRFRVRPAVIDGLLPAGTYLLAGAPKIGKSFLVLQMAYQVSMGEPFLGFSSRQGTVLYLALEDTYERLQKRLAQMTERDSERLILSVFSETLDDGLIERLTDFWREHTDTVLIIIDTLQRVRGRTPDNGSYAADYDTLARLKEFSDTYGVTVLVVHHTRKEGAEDVFNTISGTNGLMGAADGALILYKDKRITSDAVLEAVGRDQQQLRLHLSFDAAHLCWELVEVETGRLKEPQNPLIELVSRLVNEEYPSWSGTATELARSLSEMDSSRGFTPNWIVRTLNVQQENLLREYGVRYVSYRAKEARGNGWHTDFGTKSSVLYPSRRGTGKLRGDAVPRAALTGPKKKNVRCRYRHLTDALFQKVVVGILRSLVSKYDKGGTAMAYAILRFAKHKGGASKALSAHHERTKEIYASNPDIDTERTKQNFHLVTPRWSYKQEIRHRIRMAGCRVRKDSVKFVDTLVTVSPEFAKVHEAEMPEYFNRAFEFLKERIGEENIISAVVHMDEKTPHLHLCFVPLTKDKRLSAKEILGNKKAMIQWQDDFYACMSERWPELERGAPAVETKRKHLTPQWYKKVTAMDAKLEQLEAALNGINVLNAGKKREEAVALLAQLLPEVESFQAEIQRMQQAVSKSLSMQRCSAEENEALKDELTAERRKSTEQRAKLAVLEVRYKRMEKLLDKMPKEVIDKNCFHLVR